MDPFTQRMLEKAEQRSRALGISNASKFPLSECSLTTPTPASTVAAKPASSATATAPMSVNSGSSNNSGNNKIVILEKATLEASPSKPLRHYAAVNKENMEMGIEINITTAQPIGVQVEIQEQDMTDEDDDQDDDVEAQEKQALTSNSETQSVPVNQPLARLRDTSRNRLQRMGALYSNTDDLSSPIHRTEAQFHAGDDDEELTARSPRKGKQRFGKLAALANTINQWEDDTAHHDVQRPLLDAVPPPKPDLPSRPVAEPKKTTADAVDASNAAKTKQLKWDPKVLSSLEAQGFQRRESSTIKHTYDYAKQEEVTSAPAATTAPKPPVPEKSTTVSQVAKVFGNAAKVAPPINKPAPAPVANVKSGLVSGRAAIFENKAGGSQSQAAQRNQKDPCELSLKERMKLFETSNAKAMLPKAPIGQAPSISQIRAAVEEPKVHVAAVHPVTAAAQINVSQPAAKPQPKPESKLRDKVAALVASAQSSAENRIKDIDRQRQEDMQIIANRFNKQKEIFNVEPIVVAPTAPPAPSPYAAAAASRVVRPMPPPPPPPMANAASSKRRSPGDVIDEESKRARKSNTDRLYPALSDLDSSDDNCCATATASVNDDTEEELESCMDDESVEDADQSQTEDSSAGMCNGSLGRAILHTVQRNEAAQQQGKKVRYAEQDHYYSHDSSMNSSQVSGGIDDYLDEALGNEYGSTQDEDDDSDDDQHNASHLSLGSKGTTASNSFSFRRISGAGLSNACQAIEEQHEAMDVQTPLLNGAQPVKSELSVNQDNDNLVTLVHTVSFYRKQQSANSSNSTPMRKICREQQVVRSALAADCHAKHKLEYDSPQHGEAAAIANDYGSEEDEELQSARELNEAAQAQEKIKKLLSEVCKQQQVIGQASQALNLCAATVEFSGSTESVEGERYLLLATHRRQACLDEVQRLRVENSIRPVGAPKEKGLLTVKDITIPLRQEYVRKMATGNNNGHHLVCLLKYNEHVLATKTVPTMPGLLSVKFPDVLQLNNVYADFRITLEIYGMVAQRDQLPHELKYHINVNKKGGNKTPKKKGGENRLVMPPVQSPAGPHVVRTPQLVQYGFAIFSLREIQRTSWTLTQVLGVSPLDGAVHMKVNCELSVSVEYKGFLTMFEDISGFGAWHRRWCYLNGSALNYWKYPDDEKKKAPMGSIDLNACTSQKVSLAPRDICARLNTMLLECERPALESDKESLIIVPNGRTTTIRHLLSADTKEEREEWSAYLNKALTLLRAWGTTH
ncbi:LOW QUALITY PROTEIN: anillin [Drosophila nasuta]|uniref:LOW QUALITY PROTEIN: anillin n=1 Tax=Drosophila nasuta TaxID=42062 RepID=UPI00295F2D0C|nr:LOW QUALITY PROTEIN: anillin [Drosophila nasuta]